MGRGQPINRLSTQVGDRGEAIAILEKRGQLKKDGKTLTKKGKERNDMTAEKRAIDRASTKSGKPKSAYTYNPKTNTATLKK